MPELFRLETDRVRLTWTGPPAREAGPEGLLRVRLRRPSATLASATARHGIPSEVAADPAVEAGPRLLEETTYTVFVEHREGGTVELQHRDPAVLRGLTRGPDGRTVMGSVDFRSQIGRSRFHLVADGAPELDFEVEVFPSKLDYTEDYEALMAEMQEQVAGLVFEYLRATELRGDIVPSERPDRLAWLALLRRFTGDLEQALHYVAAHPRRSLIREHRSTRVERLKRADSVVRREVLRGRGRGPEIPVGSGLRVRSRLTGERTRPTLDTPEHRWLAQQVTRIRRELARVRAEEERRVARTWRRGHPRKAETTADDPDGESNSPESSEGEEASNREQTALAELRSLEQRFGHLENLEPLRAAEGLPPSGFASLQLQGAPGYREAYRTCLLLSRGLRVDGGPVGLSVKDLHLLYEYWCFLAVLRIVARVLGHRIPVERLLTVEQNGLRIRLEQGRTRTVPFDAGGGRRLEVTYAPTFSGTGDSDTQTLLPQKPDIVLTLRDPDWPTLRLVLDAKYRLNTDPAAIERYGAIGPPEDAVNVLHRYRDAILERESSGGEQGASDGIKAKRTVVEGAALFPLSDEASDGFRESRFWTSLDRLGIGALPFLPSQTELVEEWVQSVLQRSGWAAADRAVPHALRTRRHEYREASREAVLVAVLRPGGKSGRAAVSAQQEHLDWIAQERLYYTPLTPTQRRQFSTRYVAVYSPAPLRSRDGASLPGAVTHIAPVEHVDVMPRRAVSTPWPAGRKPDELQVVYHLGPVEELERPIINRGPSGKGQPFRTNRWTTRLGLLRARELPELFLETESEWRLYETLRVEGIPFTLEPGSPTPPEDESYTGRARFRVGGSVVRWRGAAGFEVRSPHTKRFVTEPEHVAFHLPSTERQSAHEA